jgi:hypothetical protein
MALSAACLGANRREWATAMRAEFEEAVDAGEPLRFALGCLWSAVPGLVTREEGRRALASHVLAIGILLPVAVLLLVSVASGFPYLTTGVIEPERAGELAPTLSVNVANRSGLPLLALLTATIGVGHLTAAWALLERHWSLVARLARAGAALVVSMLIFAAILSMGDPRALPQAAVIALELAALWMAALWQVEPPVCAEPWSAL